MCVRLCLYIHIFTYMLLHVCRALCNKEHICIRPMHADWGVSGSISTRLCCEVHQKVSGSFSATINVSRAAADRHTWFRFNVQNAIKRTCKHSDIFFSRLMLLYCSSLRTDCGRWMSLFFGAAEAPAAKTSREIVFKSLDRAGESGTGAETMN